MTAGLPQPPRNYVLGIGIDALTLTQAVRRANAWLAEAGSRQVVTANAEIVMRARADRRFGAVLAAADLVLADGAGIVWAGEQLGCRFPERVAGIDYMTALVAEAVANGTPMYFLGGAPGVAAQAAKRLTAAYGELPLVGVRDGFFALSETAEILADIRRSGARLLFVGLGVPKQEYWLAEHLPELPGVIGIGVGGSYDVLAGNLSRAPLWMQRNRLEWLYRLALQPSRAGRMAVLPRFMWAVRREAKRPKEDGTGADS